MADNIAVSQGSGTNIATDDVAGVHYQRIKLVNGTLDATDAIGGDATNGLDVDVTRVGGNVTVIQGTGTNLHTVLDSGTLTTITNSVTVSQATATNLKASVEQATAANLNATVVQATAANLNAQIVGTVAADGAVSGNPVQIAGRSLAPGTAPTAMDADGDVTRLLTDRYGDQYVLTHGPNIWAARSEYTTAQTNTSLKATPGASLSHYITDIVVTCNAAVTVTLLDGSGGTVLFRYYASAQGDGVATNFTVPIKQTANTALCVTTSGAVTCFVDVHGYTAA